MIEPKRHGVGLKQFFPSSRALRLARLKEKNIADTKRNFCAQHTKLKSFCVICAILMRSGWGFKICLLF